MIRSYPARLLRSRRTRLVAAASAGVIAWSVASAASALPTGGVVFDSTPGPVTTITPGSGTLTVDQGGDRVVIDWSTFNIGTGETVTFNQPDSHAIAFNRVDPSAFTTIDGTLAANGGVWLFSPGGLLFGAGAQVNVGSFVGSTARLQDADATAALTSNTITATDGGASGSGTLTVTNGAALTASDGFMVLLGETIVQNGQVVSNNDAVWYGVAEGGTLTVGTAGTRQTLEDATVSSTAGSTPSFTQGATGVTTAGTWVGVSTPSISGWTTVLNLGGTTSALGAKPGTQDGVVILTGADGVVDLTTGDTQLNTSGTIDSSFGVNIDVNAMTLNGDIGSSGAVAVYLTASDDIVVNGDIYGTLINLTSTGGDLTIGATSDIEGGHSAAGPAVRLYAYGDLTITAGATVTSLSDMIIQVTDAGGALYIGGSVYSSGAGSNSTFASLIYSAGDMEIAAGAVVDGAEAVLVGAVGQTTISGAVDSTSGTRVVSSDLTVTTSGVVDSDAATDLFSYGAAGTITIDGSVTSGTTTTVRAPNPGSDLTIGGTGLLGSTGAVSLSADGDLNVNVAVTAPDIDMTTANGSITVTSAVTGSIITLDSGDDILLTATADIDALSVALTGYGDTSISMTADGDLTIVSGAQVDGRWDVYLETTGVASELTVNSVVHSGGLLSIDGSYNVTLGADADVNGFATSPDSIVITADNDLDIQAGALVDAYDNMSLTATNGDFTFAGTAYGDFIDIDAGGNLTVASTGLFDINQFHADAVGDIQIDGVIDAPTTLFITSTGGDVTLGATADLSSFSIGIVADDQLTAVAGSHVDGDGGIGTLSFRAYGVDGADAALELSGDIIGYNIQLVASAGSTVLGGTITAGNNVNVYAQGGDFTTLTGSLIDNSDGRLYVRSGGDMTLAGDVNAESVNLNGSGGSISQTGGTITVETTFDADAIADFNTSAGAVITSAVDYDAGVSIYANGDLTLNGAIYAYDVFLDSEGLIPGSQIDIGGSVKADNFLFIYAEQGDIHLAATADLYAGTATTYGSIYIGAEGSITTDAGSQIHTTAYDGYISLYANDTTGVVDLSGDISSTTISLGSNFGDVDVILRAGALDAAGAIYVNSSGDLTVMDAASITAAYAGLYVDGANNGLIRIDGDISASETISIYNAVGDVEIGSTATLHGNTDGSADNGGPLGFQTDTIEITGENITAEAGSQITVGDVGDPFRGTVSITSEDQGGATTLVTLDGLVQAEAIDISVTDGSIAIDGDIFTNGDLAFDLTGTFTVGANGYIETDGYLHVLADDGIVFDGLGFAYGVELTTTTAGADIDIGGDLYSAFDIDILSAGDIGLGAGGTLQSDFVYSAGGAVNLTADGRVVTGAGSRIIVGHVGATTGDLVITAGADDTGGAPIDLSGDIYVSGLGLIAAYGSIHLADGYLYVYDSLAINTAYDFTMDGPASIHTYGDVDITAQGAMTVDGSIYAGGNISLYRYGANAYELDMGGYLYASGDVSIVNNNGDINVSGTIYAGDVSIRTPYDGDIYVTDTAFIDASGDILIEAHYSGGAGEIVVNGDLNSDSGDVAIRNLNGSLSVGLYGSIYAYGNISLYRNDTVVGSLSTSGLLHADGYVSIVSEGPGDVILGGDIIADADTDALAGYIYVSSEGQVIAPSGGSMLVGSVGFTTGDVTINAGGSDSLNYSAIDLDMDIDANGLYLNTSSGSVHLAGGDIVLTNDLNVTAAASFLMDSGATITDDGSVNITAYTQISAYGGINAGGDIYLHLADPGGNSDLAVGGYFVAGGSARLVNEGSGDVIIAATGDIVAGASPSANGPEIYISSQGHVISYAGSSLIVGEAGAPTGDVLIYAYGTGVAVDLSSDIDAQTLEITVPNGSVHLRDGALTLENAFDLYSAYDIAIDAPVTLETPGNVYIEALGDVTVAGDVYGANLEFTAGADLTVGGTLTGDYVTLTAGNDLTHSGDIIANDGVSLTSTGGDVYINGFIEGFASSGTAILVSAEGDLTIAAGGDLEGYGDVVLQTTGPGGVLEVSGDVLGYDVYLNAQGGILVGATADIYAYDSLQLVSDGPNGTIADIQIDGIMDGNGVSIINRNIGDVVFGATADVASYYYYCVSCRVDPDAPSALLGADGDIYIYSAGSVITVAGSSIDATTGLGVDKGLITIVAAGADAGGYSAIDLSGDITSYNTVLTTTNGSIHLGDGAITATESFSANSAGDFTTSSGSVVDVTIAGGHGDLDITADGDIVLGGLLDGYYIDIIGYGSLIEISGTVYATDGIEISNYGGDFNLTATGVVQAGTPYETSDPYIDIYAAGSVTTAAGSLIYTDVDYANATVTIESGQDGGIGMDLAGDIASGDVTLRVNGTGRLQVTDGTVDAQGDIYVSSYGQVHLTGGVMNAAETVYVTSSDDMLLAGDIYAASLMAHIYAGEANSVPGSAIRVDGLIYADDYIGLYSEVGAVELGANALLSSNNAGTINQGSAAVRIEGLSVTSEAGSRIETPAANASSEVLIQAFDTTGMVVDLQGDIDTGIVVINSFADGGVTIGGDLTAQGDIIIHSGAGLTVEDTATFDAVDLVSLYAADDLLVAGDIYGDYISASGASSVRVEGALTALTDITISSGQGVEIGAGAQLTGNYSGLTDVGGAAVHISGASILTEAGSLITVGDAGGPPVGQVVLQVASNFAGPGPAIDLSGDITAESLSVALNVNNDFRIRDGDINVINNFDVHTYGYFIVDDPASISSEGNVVFNADGGMIIDGDLTGDRIYLVGGGLDGLSVNGGLFARETINLYGVFGGDVVIGGYAILESDTDNLTSIGESTGINITASDQVIVEAGARLYVGPSGAPTGDVNITAYGADSGGYAAIDLSGDIEAQNLYLDTAAGSIRLRDGDITVVGDLDFSAGASFIMDGPATVYTEGDFNVSAADSVTVAGRVTALGGIDIANTGASDGAMTINGYLYAGDDVFIRNYGDGDIILGGPTIIADFDGTTGANTVFISAYGGNILAPGGGTISVGAAGDEHGSIYLHAGGLDTVDNASLDLEVDLAADTLTLISEQGSIHLGSAVDINVVNDLTITSDLDIFADAGSTITTDGDASLSAGRSLYALGDITAGGDIALQIGSPTIVGPGPGGPAYFTPQPGDMVVGGDMTANGEIYLENFAGGDIYIDGTAAIRSDADNLGTGDGVTIFGYGQVITAAGSTINAGAPGAPTAGVSIYAGGTDSADYSAIDLSGDIEGASLALYTQGSIHLRDGDITVTGDLFIGTYVDFLMEAGATINAGDDVSIVAVNSLISQGDITAGGDIYFHLDPDFYLYNGFTAGPGDLVVGGNVTANGSIDITNGGAGDIYIDGTAALTADADSTGGPDHIAIDSYGQVISAYGSTMVVGAPGATTGDVSIVAAGLDGGGYSAITLGGDIDANGLTLDADAGSIHLTGGTITVTDDLVLTSALDVITEDSSSIEAGADVSITAGRTLTARGDIDAAGAIALTLTGASTSDLTVAGIFYADDGISIVNNGTGDVLLDDGSMVWADFDGDASGDVYISANGSVITSDQGSNGAEATIVVGGVGAPTGDVTIVADGAGVAIDLSGDIQAQNLFLNAANGSIYLRNGDIDLTNDLTIDNDFNVLMDSSATIDSGGDVAMTAAGFLTVNGGIHADGDITLLLDGSNQDLSVGGLLASGGDINIDNTGLGDVLLSGSASMFSTGLIDVTAGGDIVLDGFIDSATTFNADAGDDLSFLGQIQAGTGATLHSDYDMTLNGVMIVEGFNDFTATAGATLTQNGGASVQAGGDASFQSDGDMIINGTVDVLGNATFYSYDDVAAGGVIEAANVYITGDDLDLAGAITATDGDVVADAGGTLYQDGSIQAGDDVVLTSTYDMTVNGDVTAADDIRLTVYGGEGSGDLYIDGDITADGDVYAINNADYGGVFIGANANIVADADGDSPGAYLDIYAHGFISAEAGSTLHVGGTGTRTGFITIYTDGTDGTGSAIDLEGDIDAGSIEITAGYGSVEVSDGQVAADESIVIYAGENFILGDGAVISGAEDRAVDLPKATGVVVYGDYYLPPGVSIVAGDVDIQGQIASGDQIVIAAYNVDGGEVTVGGVDNGLGTGFTLSNAEFQNLSADSIVILSGQGSGYSTAGYDLHLADLTIDAANVDDVWFGTQEDIIVEGAVTPVGDGVSLHLGFTLAYTGEDDFAPNTFLIGFVPDRILISGSLGSVDDAFGQVTLIAQGDILMGSQAFIDAAAADPEFNAAEQGDDFAPEEGHVFVASDVLQMATMGRILQQNTGGQGEYGGLVIGLPGVGQELIFVPAQLEGQTIGGSGGWLADFSAGPSRIELFGYFVTQTGDITGFHAANVDNLLDPAILVGDYYFNSCLFYSNECAASGADVPPFQSPFPPVDFTPLFDQSASFFATFPFAEPDDEEDDDEVQGEPVTGSGNEDLWTVKPGVRP